MTLAPGSRLGPYDILAPLGAGGMGEVYRARDAKLERDVALKIIPELFAADPERLARFEREARTLAALNHPHIAQIYGFEQSGGTSALVMELVEGEDLAQVIARGPLPLAESLRIGAQIVDALEAAHEQGIVHRDLKPANIKLRSDGTVKVLDFGLAKASAPGSVLDVANSPTFTLAGTQLGVIVGTAAYMAPEQARGKAVDKRADIWAFGCVLYEMLAGQQAFSGETATDILARIVEREPDWSRLPSSTPQPVVRLIRRCLEKDVKRRLRDIADARAEMEAAFEHAGTAPRAVTHARKRWTLAAAALAVVAAAAVLTVWLLRPVPGPAPIHAVTIEGAGFEDASTIAVSPDGSMVAFHRERAVGGGDLLVRQLDSFEPRVVAAGVDTLHPFFSPRGDAIAYSNSNGRALYRVPVSGGSPVELIRVGEMLPGVWLPDDSLVVSSARVGERFVRGLVRVPAGGGTATALTTASEGELHITPSPLPGGRLLLFSVVSGGTHHLAVADLDAKQHRPLVPALRGTTPRYVSTGHLVYFEPGTLRLRAVPFDPVRAEPLGDPVVVLDSVHRGIDAVGSFEISSDGHLFYSTQADATISGGSFGLVWAGPDKGEQMISDIRTTWAQPRLSPDGRRLAVRETATPNCTLWLYDLERGSRTRLTGATDPHNPVWHPDGRRIVFDALSGEGRRKIFEWRVDGTYPPSAVSTGDAGDETPRAISPDGKWLAVTRTTEATGSDLWIVPLAGGEVRRLAGSEFREDHAAFSPDGRWIAYTSNESGRDEVYVVPWPVTGERYQASAQGGTGARWARDGRSLFYAEPHRIVFVNVTTATAGTRFTADTPKRFIEGRAILQRVGNYDLAPDGKRMVIVEGNSRDLTRQRDLRVIFNWVEELKRKVPRP